MGQRRWRGEAVATGGHFAQQRRHGARGNVRRHFFSVGLRQYLGERDQRFGRAHHGCAAGKRAAIMASASVRRFNRICSFFLESNTAARKQWVVVAHALPVCFWSHGRARPSAFDRHPKRAVPRPVGSGNPAAGHALHPTSKTYMDANVFLFGSSHTTQRARRSGQRASRQDCSKKRRERRFCACAGKNLPQVLQDNRQMSYGLQCSMQVFSGRSVGRLSSPPPYLQHQATNTGMNNFPAY